MMSERQERLYALLLILGMYLLMHYGVLGSDDPCDTASNKHALLSEV